MTIISKSNPVGIDKRIYKIQQAIESEFSDTWDNFDVYGRLYLNEVDGKTTADAFIGGIDYSPNGVFLNDTKNAEFGFIVQPSRTGMSVIQADLKLICSCNLSAIRGNTSRDDEEIMLSVLHIANKFALFPNADSIITDNIADIFSPISVDSFRFRNKHPWFSFAIQFSINYKNTYC